jgi:hypothetical protein
MDLHTRLDRLAGGIESPSADIVEADLTRGRRAVRRRRTAQSVAGAAFGVAALVAAFAVAGGPQDAPADRAPVVAESRTGGLKLVAYSGAQPRNFTVDMVPEGFFIQGDNEWGLTIAPLHPKSPAVNQSAGPPLHPSVVPSADFDDPSFLLGKIAVYLEATDYRRDVTGEKVTVGQHQAVLHGIGSTQQLLIALSPKVYATIQFDVDLSKAQILEFGAGLHVHQDAIDRVAAQNPSKGAND